jgi:hypothetical protein
VKQPRLEIHDAVGVGKVARQVRIRAGQRARSHPEVAALERDLLRALLLLPKRFALQLEQLHGAVFRDHLLVFLELRLGGGATCREQEHPR